MTLLYIITIAVLYITGALLMAVFNVERHGQVWCEKNKAIVLFECAIWPVLIAGLWLATFFTD